MKTMIPDIEKAECADGYKIRIEFSDGREGVIDLEQELCGEISEPLKDLAIFRQFTVHPELQTVCWPNGADFASEYLYASVSVLKT